MIFNIWTLKEMDVYFGFDKYLSITSNHNK